MSCLPNSFNILTLNSFKFVTDKITKSMVCNTVRFLIIGIEQKKMENNFKLRNIFLKCF